MSKEAGNLIVHLLNRDPHKRLGAGKEDANEIKIHPWFKKIDWNLAMKRGLKVPKPKLKTVPKGTLNIDILGDQESNVNKVNGWEYTKETI